MEIANFINFIETIISIMNLFIIDVKKKSTGLATRTEYDLSLYYLSIYLVIKMFLIRV
jgi:hypothetical protein